MDIQTRLANLENLVNYLVKTMNKDKFYTSADIDGAKHIEQRDYEKQSANIDYLAMMVDVDIPNE